MYAIISLCECGLFHFTLRRENSDYLLLRQRLCVACKYTSCFYIIPLYGAAYRTPVFGVPAYRYCEMRDRVHPFEKESLDECNYKFLIFPWRCRPSSSRKTYANAGKCRPETERVFPAGFFLPHTANFSLGQITSWCRSSCKCGLLSITCPVILRRNVPDTYRM